MFKSVNEREEQWKTVPIDEIKVDSCCKNHIPTPEELEKTEEQYCKSGMKDLDIIVNKDGYLIDGYCALLIAKKMELTHVPVKTGNCMEGSRKMYYKEKIMELINSCDNEKWLRLIYVYVRRLLAPQEKGGCHES